MLAKNGFVQIHSVDTRSGIDESGGQSNVFLKSENLKYELVKQYPFFDEKQMVLYHWVHTYLSKFERKFGSVETGELRIDDQKIIGSRVRVLPLDPEGITTEESLVIDDHLYDTPRMYTTTRPEYVAGKMLVDRKEIIALRQKYLCDVITSDIKKKLPLNEIQISPFNIKTNIKEGVMHCVVTDIAFQLHDFFRQSAYFINEANFERIKTQAKLSYQPFSQIVPIAA